MATADYFAGCCVNIPKADFADCVNIPKAAVDADENILTAAVLAQAAMVVVAVVGEGEEAVVEEGEEQLSQLRQPCSLGQQLPLNARFQ